MEIRDVKQHFRTNSTIYISIGVGVAIGTLSTLALITHSDSAQVVQKIQQIAWRPENNQMVINLVEKSTPSRPVHLVGTNLFFNSISEAARETGHSMSMISRNVNGHIPNVKGDVFQLLSKAA